MVDSVFQSIAAKEVTANSMEVKEGTTLGGSYAGALLLQNNEISYLSLGGFYDDGARINTYSQGNHNIIITKAGNRNVDHDHYTESADPTLFIHSATSPDSDNTQWISITHDQTDGVIAVGKGNIKLSNNLECGGYILPFSSADSAAPNSSLYYSTDQSKLVFKDSGGTVRDLW